jgi:hypothetical protein
LDLKEMELVTSRKNVPGFKQKESSYFFKWYYLYITFTIWLDYSTNFSFFLLTGRQHSGNAWTLVPQVILIPYKSAFIFLKNIYW